MRPSKAATPARCSAIQDSSVNGLGNVGDRAPLTEMNHAIAQDPKVRRSYGFPLCVRRALAVFGNYASGRALNGKRESHSVAD